MPERSQKRKLRSDQSTSQIDEEVASLTNDENTLLSYFEDISNKIGNKISKRLRDTELNQREILKLIESLSSKVDNLSNVSSERGCLTDRVVNSGNSADEVEEVDLGRSECSNRWSLWRHFRITRDKIRQLLDSLRLWSSFMSVPRRSSNKSFCLIAVYILSPEVSCIW